MKAGRRERADFASGLNAGPSRARGAFAALSAALALAAHQLGGGSVTPASAALVFTLVAICGWVATRRERGRPFVLALVLGTQTVAHVMLGLSAMLALAWWLHRGERAVWGGLRRAVLRLATTPSYRAAPIAYRLRARRPALVPCFAHEHFASVSRRGPPNQSAVSLILGPAFRLSMV